MLTIAEVTRDELIKIAEAAPFVMTNELTAIVNDLIAAGRYTEATEDEIEAFDAAYDAAAN